METARCRAFLAAAETGSFSKAAEALSYTPSGVNQLVTALEKELGFPVFRRTRHLHPAAFRHPRRVHGLVRRQRHRHRRGAPAAHLRTLLPHRQGPIAQTGRHGTGAGDRQKRRCDPRRHDHGPRTRTRRAGVHLHIEETQLTNSSYTTTRPAAFAAFGCDYESEPPLTPRLGGELRRKNTRLDCCGGPAIRKRLRSPVACSCRTRPDRRPDRFFTAPRYFFTPPQRPCNAFVTSVSDLCNGKEP